MNPIERLMRAVDRRQQRHRWAAFPLAVIKKFGDDQAGNLAALLAYYAFFALFPLLLVLVSVLGILLRGNAALQQRVLHSALADFPIIGNQLQSNVHSLNRTGLGLVVGLAGLFFGARGVASAAQQAFNTVWHVPYARRPGFPWNLLRSLGLLIVVGAGVIATATLSGFGGGTGAVGLGLRIVALVGSGLLNVGLFLFALRLATAAEVPTRALAFGAAIAGVSWQALLGVGGFVVAHQLRHASQVYGLFAVVIGLLTWLHLQAQITLYAVEVDTVRAQRLWPRSLVQPPLTAGDRRAFSRYAKTEQRRPEQTVDVTFHPTADPSIQALADEPTGPVDLDPTVTTDGQR